MYVVKTILKEKRDLRFKILDIIGDETVGVSKMSKRIIKNSRVLGQYFSSMCFCHFISFGFHPAIHSEAKWNCLKLDEIK